MAMVTAAMATGPALSGAVSMPPLGVIGKPDLSIAPGIG
jgi:hypothetical protein